MIEHFGDVLAFVRVADTASFTKAAERLGVTRSAVGKSIARLEAKLLTRLVHRTTRSVRLTEEGQLFYTHALRILCEVEDAEATLSQRNQAPKGRLRVDLPTAFGRLHVLPVLQDYLAAWPALEADVSFSDDYCDLVSDGIDVAVRIGGPTESGLIRQVLAPHRLLTCATPGYLQARGTPRVLDDLKQHDQIAFTYAGLPVPWRYQSGGEHRDIGVEGSIRLSNTEAIRDAALRGAGLVQLGAFLVGADIAQGRLVSVLEQFSREEPPIVAVYPTRRHVSPKVRQFVEALRRAWAPGPPW
ncbi:LysR family transcriptional regulator [Brucella pseudogrignonensis]|uniref:LysR family transcriptional regulator n=1 Tax=Brucella pseudogrignonensis TaxID=419475 RepID=UPI00124C8835|nr:LysR family transcriptional regulator [Brucella pseudogrignonensis]KAB2689199.1 LysR family transcriptional regulator [Brucella pseudogrignonensis]